MRVIGGMVPKGKGEDEDVDGEDRDRARHSRLISFIHPNVGWTKSYSTKKEPKRGRKIRRSKLNQLSHPTKDMPAL
jgi:hypothetical protein